MILKESYSHAIVDLDNYSTTIVIEGISNGDGSSSFPISVLEHSTLETLELFVEKGDKWKKVSINKNITISTMSFSSFFSGSKNYFIQIPPITHFRILAEMNEKHTIFLTNMTMKGSNDTKEIVYEFALPEDLAISTSDGRKLLGNVRFSKKDFENEESIKYLIHPSETQPDDYFSSWFESRIEPQLMLDKSFIPSYLMEMAESNSKRELAAACFDYVQRMIKYVDIENGIHAIVPRQCEKVLENKFGDCKDMATLLTALYKFFNFDVYVTVSRTNSKDGTFDFPSLSSANHMICTLRLEEEWYFLDPTEDACLFGDPSFQIMGTEAFLIGRKGDYFQEVPNVPRTISNANFSYEFNELTSRLELFLVVTGKFNGFFHHGNLKQNDPKNAIEEMFKHLTKMNWTLDEMNIVDTCSRLKLSTPIIHNMYSVVGNQRMYDLTFLPSLKLLTAIFYNHSYPLFDGEINHSLKFGGDLKFNVDEECQKEFLVDDSKPSILTFRVTLTEQTSEIDFKEDPQQALWERMWSKPIVVAYEN